MVPFPQWAHNLYTIKKSFAMWPYGNPFILSSGKNNFSTSLLPSIFVQVSIRDTNLTTVTNEWFATLLLHTVITNPCINGHLYSSMLDKLCWTRFLGIIQNYIKNIVQPSACSIIPFSASQEKCTFHIHGLNDP